MKRAAQFAAHAHRGQLRKDGRTPYINHPVRVAMALKLAGVTDPDTLEAALLHDVIEDTEYGAADIEGVFGNYVAALVQEVTDDKTIPKGERKLRQITAPYSYRAACIKVADKLVNLQDILTAPPPWPSSRKAAYFEHAGLLVARLAAQYRLPARLLAAFERVRQAGREVGLVAAGVA